MGVRCQLCSGYLNIDYYILQIRNMPPVEQSSMPRQAEGRECLSELKAVERAKEIPMVSDTLNELEKVKNKIGELTPVKSAKEMVENSIKSLTEHPRLQGSIKAIHENSAVKKTVHSVVEHVIHPVANAVDHLDTMACGGIDSLTTAVPALHHPTGELFKSTKDTAHTYFSSVTEYVASFAISRMSLRAADYSLGLVDKVVKKDIKMLNTTDSKIRRVQRTIRALRRAGERRNRLNSDDLSQAGLVGRVCSIFHVNYFLHKFGLELEAERSHEGCDETDAPSGDNNDKSVQGDKENSFDQSTASLDHSTTSETEESTTQETHQDDEAGEEEHEDAQEQPEHYSDEHQYY